MQEERRTIIPIEESGGEIMVNGERKHEINSSFKLRESKKSIARALGLSVRTVNISYSKSETNKMNKNTKSIAWLTMFWILMANVEGFAIKGQKEVIKEINVTAEIVLKIGSDKPNEEFYELTSFDIDDNGFVYILDCGNSRIPCFNEKGEYAFTFGKYGQEPAKFYKIANENIY